MPRPFRQPALAGERRQPGEGFRSKGCQNERILVIRSGERHRFSLCLSWAGGHRRNALQKFAITKFVFRNFHRVAEDAIKTTPHHRLQPVKKSRLRQNRDGIQAIFRICSIKTSPGPRASLHHSSVLQIGSVTNKSSKEEGRFLWFRRRTSDTTLLNSAPFLLKILFQFFLRRQCQLIFGGENLPVSYTHLTLPTSE